MLKEYWICGSISKRSRGCGLLLAVGAVLFMYGALVAKSCSAQAADQDENSQSYQPMGSMQDQSTGPQADQVRAEQTRQGQSQGQSQGSGETSNQQSGRDEHRRSVQRQSERAVATLTQQRMSAEQIISILQQESAVRSSIKSEITRELQADPAAFGDEPLSDESFYERIRQNVSLRDNITMLLVRSGYSAELLALNPNFSISELPQITKPSASQVQEAPSAESPQYEDPDNPQVQHRLSPYLNMPSLSDLYSQFPATEKKLRRFGSNAFLIGTGNENELPMDLPAGPDYVLGPGDSLTVNMWGGRSDRLKRTIDRQGQIELPEAGTIMLDGMTITQAEIAIQKALNTQFQGEHVEISLGRLRTVRVYVVGDVQRPGAYDVSSLSTPLSALYAAGGPTSRGSLRVLRQYRGSKLVRQVDLYDFLLRGVRDNDDRLLPGDTVLVPPVGAQVTVEGAVRRPAIYELNGEQGLSQVLSLAGGVLVSASLKQINVERIEANQSRNMFSLQLSDSQNDANQEIAAFKVKDGDDVIIRQILPYNTQAVYLEGHVIHPGKYPYKEGMTLSDLLRSYQDVMPEPSDHAELVRLRPPDFRPETISFNLHDVLIGNDSIPLQPLDLVRIYGRYEIDSPRVEIKGEVLRPGKYPLSQGMTVADLVRTAGGFRRSAYRDEADLSSYVVKDEKNVQVGHSEVDVQKALDGDKDADSRLKPGDVLSIRRLAGWQDIGATVTISGEVEHAGSYGIQSGERLSDVLKRAGGFRKDAYPYATDFERVQVRELNEQARMQMIRRIQETPIAVSPNASTSSQTAEEMQKSLEMQRQQILMNLRNNSASGRLVINISSDISKWENTPADIELRAGDTLVIPKRPNFVMASGQVYNPVAISYVPGKRLGWYFKKAGGATSSADKKRMYVLRADGSVVPKDGGWLASNFMDVRMRPGDTIIVPEKIVGGSQFWQGLAATAQTLTAVMIPLAVSGVI